MNWQEKLLAPFNLAISSGEAEPSCLCWQAEFNLRKAKPTTPLVVQEGQIALVLSQQKIIAILENGTYPLDWFCQTTSLNMLSNMLIYFFSTKSFNDQRWGTASPIVMDDQKGNVISLRAHGTFSYQLDNPKRLWRHIPNQTKKYFSEDIIGELRSLILDQFSKSINQGEMGSQTITRERDQFSKAMKSQLAPIFTDFGLTLNSFLIQSISLPQENASTDKFNKLEKLKALYQEGVLTKEEYENKKKEILKDL